MYWAITDGRYFWELAGRRKDAIKRFIGDGLYPWPYWRKQGFRAVKVEVTEILP
jgi:hypothetical protein